MPSEKPVKVTDVREMGLNIPLEGANAIAVQTAVSEGGLNLKPQDQIETVRFQVNG